MLVRLLGSVIEVKPQFSNASFSMLTTPLGMVIDFRFERLSKAYWPIEVTLLGIEVFVHPHTKVLVAVSMMALQLLRESYFVLLASTFIEVRPPHPRKALFEMFVTLEGIVKEVISQQ